MNVSLVRFAAIIVLALPAASRADQTDKTGEKAKLVTRVYRVPASEFLLRVSPADEKNENPNSKFKKLPPTANGEMRYDVWPWFEAAGVEKASGAEAILLAGSNAVVFTGSPEMHEWVERMIGGHDCGQRVPSVEIAASLWEYEDDGFADAARGLRLFADIRQRAGASLRPLDSQLIVTKSGQRAVAVNKEAGAGRARVTPSDTKSEQATQTETEPWIQLNGARGSVLEVEPVIGPDGDLVDLQIGYHARLKRAGEARDLEIDVATNTTLASNHDAIPYSALVHDDPRPVQGGKVRRRALVIGVRVIDVAGFTREEGKNQREREDEQLIRKARAGLGAPGK